MNNRVYISKRADKDLSSLPRHVVIKLRSWIRLVQLSGIEAARKIRGYHDEPLKPPRDGQRSIRLNRSYRAFYTTVSVGGAEHFIIQEVNKHDY